MPLAAAFQDLRRTRHGDFFLSGPDFRRVAPRLRRGLPRPIQLEAGARSTLPAPALLCGPLSNAPLGTPRMASPLAELRSTTCDPAFPGPQSASAGHPEAAFRGLGAASWSSILEQHLGAASWSSILEQHSAARAGLLSERTKRNLEKARATPSRAHIEADEPGELVGFECFYIGKLKIGKLKIGKLKGVGKSGRSRPVIRPEGLAILWSFASSLSALPGRRSAPHLAWRAQLKVIFRGPAWQARPRRVDSSDPKAGCAALKSPATSPAFDHEFADPVGKVALSLPWILSPRVG